MAEAVETANARDHFQTRKGHELNKYKQSTFDTMPPKRTRVIGSVIASGTKMSMLRDQHFWLRTRCVSKSHCQEQTRLRRCSCQLEIAFGHLTLLGCSLAFERILFDITSA